MYLLSPVIRNLQWSKLGKLHTSANMLHTLFHLKLAKSSINAIETTEGTQPVLNKPKFIEQSPDNIGWKPGFSCTLYTKDIHNVTLSPKSNLR